MGASGQEHLLGPAKAFFIFFSYSPQYFLLLEYLFSLCGGVNVWCLESTGHGRQSANRGEVQSRGPCLPLCPAGGKWSSCPPPRGLKAHPHPAPSLSHGWSQMLLVRTVRHCRPRHLVKRGVGVGQGAAGHCVGGPQPPGSLLATGPCELPPLPWDRALPWDPGTLGP